MVPTTTEPPTSAGTGRSSDPAGPWAPDPLDAAGTVEEASPATGWTDAAGAAAAGAALDAGAAAGEGVEAAAGAAADDAAVVVAAGSLAAPAPSSAVVMTAISALLGTVAPSSTRISVRMPSNGDGTSAFTLSVMTSSSGSYFATLSPGCLSHLPIVPSATLSPSWGIVTLATWRFLRSAPRRAEMSRTVLLGTVSRIRPRRTMTSMSVLPPRLDWKSWGLVRWEPERA